MGLDMYLHRTKRVKDLTPEQYSKINSSIPFDEKKFDLAQITGIPGAVYLQSEVHPVGKIITYRSIFDEVGYWRKANHIHNWFVSKVQKGIDECQRVEVSKRQLESLLKTCKEVLADRSLGKKKLPTTSGFFYGGTEYDEWYFNDLNDTIAIIEAVLSKTDFKTQIIFYRSSW